MNACVLEPRPDRSPRVFSLPPHVGFADALARQIMRECANADPLTLAGVRLLLPNQRAVRSVAHAFLRQSGQAMLLPRLQAVGDTAEIEDLVLLDATADLALPPAIEPLERLMLLTPLVARWGLLTRRRTLSAAEALRYARALAQVIDQFDYAGGDPQAIATLVPGADLAVHWQQTTAFLDIVFDAWPKILAQRGQINPVARRVALLDALAQRWAEAPPAGPVLIAGSTGTIPAVGRLMRLVARLPRGAVLLPGLDTELDPESWDTLALSHPQYALRAALAQLGVNRAEVATWPHAQATDAARARTAFTHAALWPPAKTADWQTAAADFAALDRSALTLIEAATDAQEAQTIALIVRHALDTPEQTIDVVTSDRPLARRIAAQLRRYGIAIDDSAGQPLALTPPVVFLRQLALCVDTGWAPLELLALLKHPLACTSRTAGIDPAMEKERWRQGVRALDRWALRGLRPRAGVNGVREALAAARTSAAGLADAHAVVDLLARVLAPLEERFGQPQTAIVDLLDAHLTAGAALADLWRGAAGDVLAGFLSRLRDAVPPGQTLPPCDYAAWLDTVLAPQVIRPNYGKHPRVQLLSPIEARLQSPDILILAGLNEGSWPPAAEADPFLADHMRAKLGLPTSEFRLGQAAHDFAQCLGAARVFLTRARKSQDAPTLASRLWLRTQACLDRAEPAPSPYLLLAQTLDVPTAVQACPEPGPMVPNEALPQQISVSDMALWRQNPFAFHAKCILRLRGLDPLDSDPNASSRGTLLHEALELFFTLPPQARTRAALLAAGAQAFAPVWQRPTVRALWWPRFEKLADALLASPLMTDDTTALHVEAKGAMHLPAGSRSLEIVGRADRIERASDGQLTVYDYKSGTKPSGVQVRAARAPQLPLLALMARRGGYPGVAAGPVSTIGYIEIKGSAKAPMKITPIKPESGQTMDDLLDQAAAILIDWISHFNDPRQPWRYLRRAGVDEYAHLARLAEWQDSL